MLGILTDSGQSVGRKVDDMTNEETVMAHRALKARNDYRRQEFSAGNDGTAEYELTGSWAGWTWRVVLVVA